MSLVEAGVAVRVVNAPVPAVVAPMETKLAAPAPEIFQLSSSRAKEEEAVVVPMVIELATAPVPILIVSAVVPPVPMDMVSAPVPVPILMALVRLPPAPRFKVETVVKSIVPTLSVIKESPIVLVPVNLGIVPEVPEPATGSPEEQVITLLPESTQRPEDAVPDVNPERIKVESESRVKVMSLVEAGVAVRVVNAPVPAVVAPMETKLAAPAPEIFQLSSSRAKEEEAVVVPMVIELLIAPVPILIVLVLYPPVPKLSV